MEYVAYGHSFKNERDMNGYKKMKADSRKRALDRKKGMSEQEKSDATVRSHFAKEARHFKI